MGTNLLLPLDSDGVEFLLELGVFTIFAAAVIETVLDVAATSLVTPAFTNTVLGVVAAVFIVLVYLNHCLLDCPMVNI